MNKFIHRKSGFAVILMYFCLLALFVDGSNITDLLSNVTTLHFEEGDGISLASEAATFSANVLPSFTLLKTGVPVHIGSGNRESIKRVILDQDSPALEPAVINHLVGNYISPEEKKIPVHSIFYSESLFLNYCSLLI